MDDAARPPLRFRDVLVAVDGSIHAELALVQAIALAQRDHARLTVLTVAGRVGAAAWAGAVDAVALQEQVDRDAERVMRAAVDLVPDDLPVRTVFLHGAAGPAIVEQIRRGDHDAVVLGARGIGRIGQLFGSVSRHVLHHAGIAVFVAHAPNDGDHDAAS